MDFALFCNEADLDAIAAGLIAHGVECTVVPEACAIKIAFDFSSGQMLQDGLLPGITVDKRERILRVLLGRTEPLCPFEYNSCACRLSCVSHKNNFLIFGLSLNFVGYHRTGPFVDVFPPHGGAGKGGVWCLFRASQATDGCVQFLPLMEDDKLKAMAFKCMRKVRRAEFFRKWLCIRQRIVD